MDMTSLLIHFGQSMTQNDADTTDENCTPPEVNVKGVVSVTSSQHARCRFPDMEQTSLSEVSIGALAGGAVKSDSSEEVS